MIDLVQPQRSGRKASYSRLSGMSLFSTVVLSFALLLGCGPSDSDRAAAADTVRRSEEEITKLRDERDDLVQSRQQIEAELQTLEDAAEKIDGPAGFRFEPFVFSELESLIERIRFGGEGWNLTYAESQVSRDQRETPPHQENDSGGATNTSVVEPEPVEEQEPVEESKSAEEPELLVGFCNYHTLQQVWFSIETGEQVDVRLGIPAMRERLYGRSISGIPSEPLLVPLIFRDYQLEGIGGSACGEPLRASLLLMAESRVAYSMFYNSNFSQVVGLLRSDDLPYDYKALFESVGGIVAAFSLDGSDSYQILVEPDVQSDFGAYPFVATSATLSPDGESLLWKEVGQEPDGYLCRLYRAPISDIPIYRADIGAYLVSEFQRNCLVDKFEISLDDFAGYASDLDRQVWFELPEAPPSSRFDVEFALPLVDGTYAFAAHDNESGVAYLYQWMGGDEEPTLLGTANNQVGYYYPEWYPLGVVMSDQLTDASFSLQGIG